MKFCRAFTSSLQQDKGYGVFQALSAQDPNIISTTTTTRSRPKPLPLSAMPGPGGLKKIPYLGALLLFQPFGPYHPHTFGQMINEMHEKYGPIFKTRLGKNYSVHTDRIEDIQTIFRNEGAYPKRRLMMLSKLYRKRNGLPNALGTVSGPEWHELRSPLNPLLNKPKMCLHYLPAQNLVADDFVTRIQEERTSAEDISEIFFKFAAENIGVVCFNHRMGFLDKQLDETTESKRLLEAFKMTLHCTFTAMIGLERRFLFTTNDPFYQSYSDAMKFIRKQSLYYVEKVRRELTKTDSAKTQSSSLLASLILNSGLDIEKILAIIDSMLIAGTDSTARNLTMLLYNFAKNPDKQIKAAEEVLSLIGPEGNVTAEAMSSMSYLKACVKESMRLHFPLANGTERILPTDTVLSGYLVPAGTGVLMSNGRTGMDPKNFTDPLSFLPERWARNSSSKRLSQSKSSNDRINTDDDNDQIIFNTIQFNNEAILDTYQNVQNYNSCPTNRNSDKKSFAFACLPFGHGARGCMGRRFAEMEIYVGAAKLLQKLVVEVDPSYKSLETIYTPFITPKTAIPFVFRPRSKVEL